MAFTRKMLKDLGIEGEVIDKIIEEHRGTVDSLKDELDNLRAEIDSAKDIKKELDKLKEESQKKDSYKEKYDDLKKEFDKFKADTEGEKVTARKSDAYKKALKEAGISEKRIESVMRLAKADGFIDKLEFDGENVKELDKIKDTIKNTYGDYIEHSTVVGADTANPPSNSGNGSKMTKAEIYAKDDKGRYKLSTEERQKAIADNIGEFQS